MKKLVIIAVFFMTFLGYSQEPITMTVGEFTELKAYDLINVELIKSEENRVEISGKNASDVVVVNNNGKLKIRMKLEEYYDGNDTMVKLYYTAVDILDANEGAYIVAAEPINQYEMELRAQEGGKIKANLEVKRAEVKAVTGGIVELKGKVDTQDIKIGAGGIFKGSEFESVNTNVSIKAGGEADVNASELADIKIRAGGDVFVYGNPNTVKENRALGGRIKLMN